MKLLLLRSRALPPCSYVESMSGIIGDFSFLKNVVINLGLDNLLTQATESRQRKVTWLVGNHPDLCWVSYALYFRVGFKYD